MGGGALLDLGVYCLHLAKHFADERKLLDVKASVVSAPGGVDLADFALLEYSGGFVAEISCGITFFALNDAYIFGDEGYIRVMPWFNSGRKIELFTAPFPGSADYWDAKPADEYGRETPSGFEFEITHMMDRIHEGSIQSDIIPLADTIEVAETMDRIRGASGDRPGSPILPGSRSPLPVPV
jgi:predicted dehydrogenase